MYKAIFVLAVCLATSGSYCQSQGIAPGIKWSRLCGSSGYDEVWPPNKVSLIDRDGLYMIGGVNGVDDRDVKTSHKMINGNPTQEIWVAKLDTQRNIMWSASLGGSNDEDFGSLQLAHDSGYIVTGSTYSNDGDVSGNHGGSDAWIARLGRRGNVVWQKCLGGSNFDNGTYIGTTDDGYIFLGRTNSTDGDLAGLPGTTIDLWVIKLDKNGNVQWQKRFGGSSDEESAAIKQATDGGYIVTGNTSSMDGDVQGLHGIKEDIWVIKLDKNGAMEWQKCLGGSNNERAYDVELTATGGYMIAGSASSKDGDVVGLYSSDTTDDATNAWVISLNSTGTMEWQKCFSKGLNEEFYDILMLPDRSILAVGITFNNIDTIGPSPACWLVNFNSSGNVIWEKPFIIPDASDIPQFGASLAVTSTGNILVIGRCFIHSVDICLFEAGATNTIRGYAFYDANSDGIKNSNESFFDQVIIRSTNNAKVNSAIPSNGYYKIDVDTGSYTIQAVPNSPYYTSIPAVKNVTFTSFFNTDSANFAIQPLPSMRDMNVNLFSLIPARPGFGVIYQINYKNAGSDLVEAGSIKLANDHRLNYVISTPAPTTISNDTISWNFTNFSPNTDSTISVTFLAEAPPVLNAGDTLHSVAWIQQDRTDLTPIDDTVSFKQVVTGSFDPNDKTEANAGAITTAQLSKGEYLNYLIRFQNKGSDTAFNITVRDTLESRLDPNSLQMISASHNYQLSIENGNKLTWQFNDIKLPYDGIDEPASHGYIAYRIKPLSSVHVGDTLKNSASIYFDYNLPVITNTEKTIVLDLTAPLPVSLISFNAFETGSTVQVNWKTAIEENINHFEVQRSSNGIDFITIGTVSPGNKTYIFKDDKPFIGYNYYRLKSVDNNEKLAYSTVVMVNVENRSDIISLLYPNPAKGNVTLQLQGLIKDKISIQIMDESGRPVFLKRFTVQQTSELSIPLNTGKLTAGHYVLQIIVGKNKYLHKLVIQ
jgi:uncharacterized repeat protein (TIGR01451 family)